MQKYVVDLENIFYFSQEGNGRRIVGNKENRVKKLHYISFNLYKGVTKQKLQQLYSNSMRINPADDSKPRRLFKHLKIQTFRTQSKDSDSDQKTLDTRTKICLPGCTTGKIRESYLDHRFEDAFEKGKKLGEGAHACVYEYTQKKTRKAFAVKVFKDCDCQRIKSIKQSFMIMTELEHPHIVKTVSLYIEKVTSRCYLVTQFCNYKDLRCFIENQASNGKSMSEQRIANIIYQILKCLSYLKTKGVCHRDIKPENILYDPENENIKLIDFQLSKMKKSDEEAFEMWTYTGSLFYRAPQSFALGYTEAIDMWATGIVAFQLLTGTLPFTSTSTKSVTEDIIKKEIDFDEYNISKEAQSFLQEILDKNPQRRVKPQKALNSTFIFKNCSKLLTFPEVFLKSDSQIDEISEESKNQQQNEDFCSDMQEEWEKLNVLSILIN